MAASGFSAPKKEEEEEDKEKPTKAQPKLDEEYECPIKKAEREFFEIILEEQEARLELRKQKHDDQDEQ